MYAETCMSYKNWNDFFFFLFQAQACRRSSVYCFTSASYILCLTLKSVKMIMMLTWRLYFALKMTFSYVNNIWSVWLLYLLVQMICSCYSVVDKCFNIFHCKISRWPCPLLAIETLNDNIYYSRWRFLWKYIFLKKVNKIIVHMSCCCSFLYSIEVINLSYALSLALLLVTRRNCNCSEGVIHLRWNFGI